MNEIIITSLIGLFTTIVSGISSWLLAKRKYNAEVDHSIIDNMKESLEFYQNLSNDNKDRLTEALAENKQLRQDMDRISEENKELKRDIVQLRNQIVGLATSICTDLSCQLRKREQSTLNIENYEESNPK